MIIDIEKLKLKAKAEFMPDILFHTLLGMMEVNTSVHVERLDVLAGSRIKSRGQG